MAAEHITWAGRTLSGTDRFGRWVTLNDQFEGWWDSPDPKGETEDRANADGEYDLPIYNQARLITIGGHLHTAGHAQTHEAMNFLTGPMSGRFQVSGHGSVQWADAKRSSGVKFTPITDTFAQWQLRLKCPDPRKFGASRTFLASVGVNAAAFHGGNYEAAPRFVVSGSMPGGYTLWVGGQSFTVTRALTSGNAHTINYDDGRLRIGGSVIHGGLGTTSTPRIRPGTTATVAITPVTTGTATAALTLLDTYI